MRHILKSYLRRLSNLTGKNRSLFLPRLSNDQFIDLHDFDFAHKKSSFSLIESLIAQENDIILCPVSDPRNSDTNELSKKLRKLKRIEKFISEESGARDLYVGWPFLRGKFNNDSLVRCPLLFFPVSIEMEDDNWVMRPRKDLTVSINKTFLSAYSLINQIKTDDDLLDHSFEDFENDSRVFRTSLYKLFTNSQIVFNFNQENFLDKLNAFEQFNKKDFEESNKLGELKLFPEAVLGLFPQADSFLVPDYNTLLEDSSFQDLEDFFYSRSFRDDVPEYSEEKKHSLTYLNKVKEEQTFTPYNIDSWQENAVKAVKQGHSLVVQGPPGSGKSELICNLIADFISRGKRVLLVCQKRAALDVVFQRLEEKELTPFAGMVHDFKNDRKDIFHQIDRQLNRIAEFKHQNNSLDAIQLERNFTMASRRIEQLTEELEEFKQALFDENECGVSVKELYLSTDLNQPVINVKQEYQYFKCDELDVFLRKLKSYFIFSVKLEKEGYPWKDRKTFIGYGISEMKRIQEILDDIPLFKEKLQELSEKILEVPISFEAAEFIANKDQQLQEMLLLLETPKVYEYFRYQVDFGDKETDPLWLSNVERLIMACYDGHGPEETVLSEKLGFYQEIIQNSMSTQNNPFTYFFWKYFSKENRILKRIMDRNQIKNNKEGFNVLVEKIDSRLNLEHNIAKLRNTPWITDIPEVFDKISFQSFFYHQKRALIAKMVFSSLRNFKEYFNIATLGYDDLKIKLSSVLFICKQVPVKKQEWQVFLTSGQIHNIMEDPLYADRSKKTLQTDFEDLCEFDKIKESLNPYEVLVTQKLIEKAPVPVQKTAPALFLNSVRMAWIDHIETKYPILRSVSSEKFRIMEEELQKCILDKMNASKDIVLLRLKEQTYKDVEYNRLNNMVTYRDLQHQVTKKKRIWSLRKVVQAHPDELFNLIPCWLASPETVSAIFPMEQTFDLVIFDEASQCFVEKGLPAMYRGKQVVITGDDKQLSPNDLYRIKWEEEEESPELEVDSLLDLCKQHLMQVHLQGHYRSRDLNLIQFSNKHFYDDKLKMLPDFNDVNNGSAAIKYIKVEGIWLNNQNEVEAYEVLELVKTLINDKPEKSIGIVTFNAPQQQLIADILDQESINTSFKIPDNLFIKNIENVQGDERDIIIFSTAYAPDKKGKLMMNFGSLNAEGGENRLNVAITRAKETIYIVSSVLPQQLKVDNLKNKGPKLLKEYLVYALNVSEGTFRIEKNKTEKFNLNWYLKNKLAELNGNFSIQSEIVDEVPFADLSIKKGGKYTGLILTDDDLYYNGVSVKERHVYTHFNLKNKNWKFKTIFSREYWHDPEATKDLTLRFINQTEVDV